jgi:hypothetical protein
VPATLAQPGVLPLTTAEMAESLCAGCSERVFTEVPPSLEAPSAKTCRNADVCPAACTYAFLYARACVHLGHRDAEASRAGTDLRVVALSTSAPPETAHFCHSGCVMS